MVGGPGHGAPRVVLDTNVCLDLFVFGDPRCAALRSDLERGQIEAVTDPACRAEWLAVLGYPALALDEQVRVRAMAAFDARVRMVADAVPLPRLPRCADPDDQKFLALAATSGARWLFSRDRAVLALARRLQREERFMVMEPQAWTGVAAAANGRLDVRDDQSSGASGAAMSSAKPV